MRNLGVSADPFGEPVRPGRLLALMEDDAAAPRRGWWVSKEDGDAVQLKVPMPGRPGDRGGGHRGRRR